MPNSKGQRQGTRKKLANSPRERGMSPPQRSVQEFESNDKVHLVLDPSVTDGQFHPRFNGHTGTVVGKQGAAFKVKINDRGSQKTIITKSAHLRPQK